MSGLLDALPEAELARVLAAARRRRFPAGEVVFHEGDLADSLHLITRGMVAVGTTNRQGNEVTYSVLGEGDVFGELAIIGADTHRSATVRALRATETLAIDRETCQRLWRRHEAVAGFLMAVLVQRVGRLSEHLVEALYVPAEVRVLRRLLALAIGPEEGAAGAPVELTQDELAGLAGTSRATVNRILRSEQRRGTVRLERRRVTIVDRERLAARAR